MKLKTKNGHSLFDVSSALQKAIRRNDELVAGYAVNELRGWYNAYLWRRLLIISAEDCWGCITKEIEALRSADHYFNKNRKGYDRNGEFLSKATTLLLKAYKNRDSDWFACNMIQSEETMNIEKYIEIKDNQAREEIPEYAYDCHTLKGKRMGKTKADMIKDEQEALTPHKKGEYDDRKWDTFHKSMKRIKQNNFNKPKKGVHPPIKDLSKKTHFDEEQKKLF